MVKYPFVLPLETFYDLFLLGFGGDHIPLKDEFYSDLSDLEFLDVP